jgi:hypothetical protein
MNFACACWGESFGKFMPVVLGNCIVAEKESKRFKVHSAPGISIVATGMAPAVNAVVVLADRRNVAVIPAALQGGRR